MPQNARSNAKRSPRLSKADLLYPGDAAPDDVNQDEQKFSQRDSDSSSSPSTADKLYPAINGSDDSRCYKPESEIDRVVRSASASGAQDELGPVEYIGKFDVAMAKGAASVLRDVFNGSKDTAGFLLDLSGSNGDDAKYKARTELGAFVDGTTAGGTAAYHGLQAYYTNPEIRDAVNSSIQKHAPEMWEKIKDGGWAFVRDLASDPEKGGRSTGRALVSAGMSAKTKSESAAKFFVKTLARIGNLDATGKDVQSKVEGLLFGADQANRDPEQNTQ